MEWYVYLIASLAALWTTYLVRTSRDLPPGPWGLPLLGYLPWIDPSAPYRTLTALAARYGRVYAVRMGSVYTVVVTDVELIKQLLASDSTTGRAPLYLTHGIMQGYGLICAEGQLWKEHRRFVRNTLRRLGGTKAAAGGNRAGMARLIAEHVQGFVEEVEARGGGGCDPSGPLRHALGSIMNAIVLGRTWDRHDEQWLWLQELQEEGTKRIGVAGPLNFLPWLRFLPSYRRTMRFILKGKRDTHELYRKIIAEQTGGHDNIVQAFLLEKSQRSPADARQFYNDRQFHHLLADLFGAGLDTTLTTLSWYLLYMAAAPAAQEAVRAEMGDGPPSLEDAPRLPLLRATICEAQRIRSVVPLGIPHGASRDLRVGGYKVPKGAMIVPLQWAVHMDEAAWEEPERFDPWRFLDEEGRLRRPRNFMPFQSGKRMCVGDDLARTLLFAFAAAVLHKFHLSLEEESDVDFSGECGITLTPKPHKILFTKVK